MMVLVLIWPPSLITVSAQDRQPAPAPAMSANEAYRQGHDLYEKKNYAEAMRCITGARAADPVLIAANFARLLVGTTDAAHQTTMRLMQQAHGKRQPSSALDLPSCVLDRVEVVADFVYITDVSSRRLLGFVLERSIRVA
jgi:hypothetical protein